MNGWNALAGLLFSLMMIVSVSARAESVAGFPTGWESWPIHHTGTIPPKGTVVPVDLPEAFQSTFRAYNWVNEGGGAAYNVRMATPVIGIERNALPDGLTGVLEIPVMKILLVTEHREGKPVYGAYGYDGADLSGAHPTVSAKFCNACHESYPKVCVNGVCNINRR
jgi:hypothetical protein